MKRRVTVTFTAALLGLGFWTLTALSADDDEKKAAQEAVLKLVDAINKGGDVKGQIAAITQKFDELEPIMWVYKPKKKGGIGMGRGGEDDIELTLGKLGSPTGKAKLTPKKLADLKDDLIKVGELSKAIALISEQDKYVQNYGKKGPAKWKSYTKEMKKGGEELIQAVRGGDINKVKTAANNLSASCTNCHSDFRE
jgi:polyhydroxyalkanoate synthesis regulator phasin